MGALSDLIVALCCACRSTRRSRVKDPAVPDAPITLLRVGRVHTPEPVAATEILIAGGTIAALGQGLTVPSDWPVVVVDEPDLTAVPAFIDQHIHVTGGGGEGGPATRCPPVTAEAIAAHGIGTVVGVLGTDSVSRSPADLLAAVRKLRAQGVDAYMYTGSYRVPPPTLTGDLQRDLAWIPEVLGVGEIAIADHRSSQPTDAELARLVSEVRVGAMLAGKAGICHVHVGDGASGLDRLRTLLETTEIPARQVIPTHVNRRPELLADAADYAVRFGACVDVTAFDDAGPEDIGADVAVRELLNAGVPAAQITISSDCGGSLPVFDARGGYAGMRVAGHGAFLADWQRLVRAQTLPFARALDLVSGNVARVLGLDAQKGRLAVGMDADIALLDTEFVPRATYASGARIFSA